MRYIGFLTNIANGYNRIPTKDITAGTKLANTYNIQLENYMNKPEEVIERNIKTNLNINKYNDIANEFSL